MNWWLVALVLAIYVVAARHTARRHARRRAPSRHPGYNAALRSRHWRVTIQREVWHRAKGRCEARWCRKRRHLTKHHLTYERLGHELASDVMLLCPKHHARADAARRRQEARR